MPAHAAIGVHNDLAAGEAGITHGSANYEAAGGIGDDFELCIAHASRHNGVNHMLDELSLQLVRSWVRMLDTCHWHVVLLQNKVRILLKQAFHIFQLH